MTGIIFDTSIWIAYKPVKLPPNLIMSAVVLQELIAGSADAAELRRYQSARRQFEKDGRYLVPDGDDWIRAGKAINSLLRRLKAQSGGLTPRLQPNQKHRIVHDTLIAVSAHRINALVVTENMADFQTIRRYCKVRIKSGRDYFRL